MKISVITISKNCKPTIERTIKSVLNQEYKDKEYIVIDGDSIDGTKEVLEKYKPFVDKIVSENDEGIYHAINKGIKLAKGDIISLIHGNDMFAHEKVLTDVANNFRDNNNLDILIADVAFKNKLDDNKYIRYYPSKTFRPWMLRFGYSPPHLSSFFSRNVKNSIGLYNTDFKIAGDFEYFVRCFLKNKLKYKKLNKCFVYMSLGGVSNRNIKSYLISSNEINKALKKNSFYSNIILTFVRFPLKLIQYLF